MTFIGYCTTKTLAKFLGFGDTETYSIDSYDPLVNYILPTVSSDGVRGYIIADTFTATADGVLIDSANYTVDVDTGAITFTTHPATDSEVNINYYLNSDFSNDDLESYITLGAYDLEKKTSHKFRELTVTDYTCDVNDGYDYLNPTNKTHLELPYYPILSVSALSVNGTDVTPSTLKIKNNLICLTESSEVSEFTGDADSIVLSFVYGITDTVEDRSDEDIITLKLAGEANKYASFLSIAESPLGRNALLENSKAVSLSDGQIRPDTISDGLINKVETMYVKEISNLKAYSTSLI